MMKRSLLTAILAVGLIGLVDVANSSAQCCEPSCGCENACGGGCGNACEPLLRLRNCLRWRMLWRRWWIAVPSSWHVLASWRRLLWWM